jgi:hypothetical protein
VRKTPIGFEDLLAAYTTYPDAFYYMDYMVTVGMFMLKSIKSASFNKNETISEVSELESNDINAIKTVVSYSLSEVKEKKLSNILTKSVEVYSCLNGKYTDEQLDNVLFNFIESMYTIDQENWIDCANAFNILGECAKRNKKVMKTFLYVSNGGYPGEDERLKLNIETWRWELAFIYVDILANICINSTIASIKMKALLGFHKDANEALTNKNVQLNGYGLIDTAKFKISRAKNHEGFSIFIITQILTNR